MNLDNYVCKGQMSIFDLGTPFTKMSPEPSAQTKEKTSDVSLKKLPRLQTKTPQYLNLRKERNGRTQDSYWETDIQSLGVYMISNTSAAPKDEKGYVYSLTSMETPQEKYSLNCGEKPLTETPSKLSDILETNPDPKYQLSAKACQGILNRANRRGKKLPEVLEQALRNQIAHTLSKSGGGCERDSNGKRAGKGALVQTEKSGTLGVSQDQTLISFGVTTKGNGDAFINQETHTSLSIGGGQAGQGYPCVMEKCLNPWDVQSKHIQPADGKAEAPYSGECRGGGGESYVMQTSDGDIAGTLDASYYKGCGLRQGRERTIVCSYQETTGTLSPGAHAGSYNGQDAYNDMLVVDSKETMHDQQAVMVQKEPILLESNQNHATVQEDGISTALPASMGMGGGYVPMVTYGVDCYNQTQSEEQAKTLTSGRNDKNNIPCVYGVDQQGGKGGANYTEDVAPTLASDSHGTPHGVCYGLDRASFNQGKNAQYDFSVEEETAQTLVSRGPGGGTSETVGALCARDFKGVGSQYVNEQKVIVQDRRS